MIKPTSSQDPNGNGLWFTFVTEPVANFTVPDLSPTEAGNEANIQHGTFFTADEAAFDVVQLQSGKSAVVKITAVDSPHDGATGDGANYVDNLLDDFANFATRSVEITQVVLTGALSTTLSRPLSGTGTTSSGGVTATWNADGSVTLAGILAGTQIAYTTDGDHDRVLIQNAGSGTGNASAAFDIGGFEILSTSTTATEIGSKVRFEDDGPSVTGTIIAAPTLTVDETVLATDDTQAFAGQFTTDFGADGAGSTGTSYALSTVGGNSGLVDTATGNSVFLFEESGEIVGREGDRRLGRGDGRDRLRGQRRWRR
jgi:hypothetical protein